MFNFVLLGSEEGGYVVDLGVIVFLDESFF